MSQEPGDEPLFTGISEFGTALAEFVRAELSAHGAILSDDDGDPIDFAHRLGAVTPLDLQIAGAQVEQAATRMSAWCARQGLGRCEILIEASHGLLLSAMPGHGYVLASLHSSPGLGAARENAADPARDATSDHAALIHASDHGSEDPDRSPTPEPVVDARDALLGRFAALRRRIAVLIQ